MAKEVTKRAPKDLTNYDLRGLRRRVLALEEAAADTDAVLARIANLVAELQRDLPAVAARKRRA